MRYKKGKEIRFADLAIRKSLDHNRRLKMMNHVERAVKWKDVEALSIEHCWTGTRNGGAGAYPAP
jgi:hypothetical protein